MESYYAHIENNVVTSVEVVTDEFFNNNSDRYKGLWLKVGNDPIRGFCSRGYIYLPEKDKIIPPKPFPSWRLNVNNEWTAPIPKPEGRYYWDEDTLVWKPNISI